MAKVFALGSPMIDIIVEINSEFFQENNLKPDTANGAIYEAINAKLENYNRNFRLGGSITNTLRVFRTLTSQNTSIGFAAAVGNDSNGKLLMDALENEKINCFFSVKNGEKTDTCLVLLANSSRTLITDLKASLLFKKEDLLTVKCMEFLKSSQFIYFSAFFLRISKEVIEFVLSLSTGKTVTFNLGADFLIDDFKNEILFEILPKISVLFGNIQEFTALAKALNVENSNLHEKLSKTAKILKDNATIIVTNSSKEVIVYQNNKIHRFPVPKANVKDTNGAGDAFVGGFLSEFIKNPQNTENNLHLCMQGALEAAKNYMESSKKLI